MFYIVSSFVGCDGKFYHEIIWEPVPIYDPIYLEKVEAFGRVDYNEWNW